MTLSSCIEAFDSAASSSDETVGTLISSSSILAAISKDPMANRGSAASERAHAGWHEDTPPRKSGSTWVDGHAVCDSQARAEAGDEGPTPEEQLAGAL